MDDYAYFPTDDADETLKDVIGQIDIFVEETISVLDGAIEAWKSYLLTESERFGHTISELIKPTHLPATHTWWLQESNSF